MDVAVATELGMWQRLQSDAHLAETLGSGITFCGVADGFGSPAPREGRGRTADRQTSTAAAALGLVRDYLKRRHRGGSFTGRTASQASMRALLLGALDNANARLYATSGSHEDFVGSGTSLTTALIVGHHAFIGHVGDARAYLLRLGRIEALTADDAMFSEGAVTSTKSSLPAKPRPHPLLWRSLGTQAKLEASIAHVELLAGDQLVLCTDGVHRTLSVEEIGDSLAVSESASEVVARLLATVKMRGCIDNGTLLVARDLLIPSTTVGPKRRTLARFAIPIASALVVVAALMLGLYLTYGTDGRQSLTFTQKQH